MIRIIDTDYQRIDLLVIPVDTTPAIAELALTMVTDGQDPYIIATVGHHSASVHRGVEAEESPDTDEGALQHRAHDRASGTPLSDALGRLRIVSCPTGPTEHIDVSHPDRRALA